MDLYFVLLEGWGSGLSTSGPNTGGSGWDSKAPANGGAGQSSWDDGSSYKGSNNTSNTWSNNKDDR